MKQIVTLFLTVFIYCINTFGQSNSSFQPELLDLGDAKINNTTTTDAGDYVLQEFQIEVQKTGKYYLSAWVNGCLDDKGEKLEYIVNINQEKKSIK